MLTLPSASFCDTTVLLRDYLPGVNLTPEFILQRKVENPLWLRSQFLYWLAAHPQQAKILDARKWKANLSKWIHGDVYLPDLHPRVMEAKLLRDLGLLELVEQDQEFNKHSPLIQKIMAEALRLCSLLQRRFNLSISEKTEEIPFIRRMLLKVGLNLVKTRGDGEQRFYRVAGVYETDRRAVLIAWNQKYADFQSEREKLTLQACYLNTQADMSGDRPDRDFEDSLAVRDVENSVSRWEEPEAVEDVATIIDACEDASMLQTVRSLEGLPQKTWHLADRLLSESKREQVRKWMNQLIGKGSVPLENSS